MGAYGNGDDKQAKGNKGRRGSVNNARRLAGLRPGESANGRGNWDTCDTRYVAAVVIGITRIGGAVTFGLSRDGFAHSLTLLLDGERETLWFNADADLDVELEKVVAYLETLQ